MLALFTIGNIVSFAAGGALIWFCKDKILHLVIGANALSAKLHDKADSLMKRF
jgi:hypothetical protein